MRQLLIISLALMAAVAPVSAAKRDKKAKQKAPAADTIRVATAADSLSYAAGMAATEGLTRYLQQRLHVDTAYMAEFFRGYKEAVRRMDDPAYAAYMAGQQIARQANEQILPGQGRQLAGTPDSLRAPQFNAGFIAGVAGDRSVMSTQTARQYFIERSEAIAKARNEQWKRDNEQWLTDNKQKPGVVTLPSGLQYRIIKEGDGPRPTRGQTVNVVYEGRTIDGHVFDATSKHGGKQSDSFRCDDVIKGWTEALTMMPVGSKWQLFIPQDLAYGSRQAGDIRPYSTLDFTVELLGIEPDPTADKADEAKAAGQPTAEHGKDAAQPRLTNQSANADKGKTETQHSRTSASKPAARTQHKGKVGRRPAHRRK